MRKSERDVYVRGRVKCQRSFGDSLATMPRSGIDRVALVLGVKERERETAVRADLVILRRWKSPGAFSGVENPSDDVRATAETGRDISRMKIYGRHPGIAWASPRNTSCFGQVLATCTRYK